MCKTDQNWLKKTSYIRLPKFTSIDMAKKCHHRPIFSIENLFFEDHCFGSPMTDVFSTDSDLSYIYLQYESEKVHGLFGLGWKNQEHTDCLVTPVHIITFLEVNCPATSGA